MQQGSCSTGRDTDHHGRRRTSRSTDVNDVPDHLVVYLDLFDQFPGMKDVCRTGNCGYARTNNVVRVHTPVMARHNLKLLVCLGVVHQQL